MNSLKNSSRHFSHGFLLTIIIAMGLLLRLCYLGEMQDNPLPLFMAASPSFDAHNFIMLAKDILAHPWVGSYPTGYSSAYSYFVALAFYFFGHSLNSVFVIQIMLGTTLIYLIFCTTRDLFDNKEIGLIASLITALYGPFLFYECNVLRESIITFCNLLSFFLLLKALKLNKSFYFLLAGMTAGLTLALRPGFLAFFLIVYIFFAFKASIRLKALSVALFVLGVMIVVSPFWLRNNAVGARMIVERPGPTIFWIGNTYDADGMGFYATQTEERLASITKGKVGKTIEVLWNQIKLHPQEYKNLYLRKFQMLFNGYEVPSTDSYDLAQENSAILKVSFFDFCLIAPLALMGLILMFRKPHAGLLYLFVFALNLLLFVFYVQSRHRIPIIPFYIMAASYTIYWCFLSFQRHEYRALAIALAGLVFLALFTKPNDKIINQIFRARIRSIDFSNMALAYRYVYETKQSDLSKTQKQELLSKAIQFRQKSFVSSPPEYLPFYYSDLDKLHVMLGKL